MLLIMIDYDYIVDNGDDIDNLFVMIVMMLVHCGYPFLLS